MKKYSFIAAFVLVVTATQAQIKFEPGYFTNNDGQRAECEIRNVDWESNPTTFQYRIAGGETQEDAGQHPAVEQDLLPVALVRQGVRPGTGCGSRSP